MIFLETNFEHNFSRTRIFGLKDLIVLPSNPKISAMGPVISFGWSLFF